MRKKILIVNLIIVFFMTIFLLIKPPSLLAQELNQTTDLKILIELLKILFSFNSIQTSTPPPTLTPELTPISPSPFPSQLPITNYQLPDSQYVYYPQCGGPYDTYPYPPNCNLCQAGCGPTTVAMILASYVDKKFNPITVSDLYKQKNFYLGCDGTSILHAKAIIDQEGKEKGFGTTNTLLNYTETDNNFAISDMKNYIKEGWTIFALARFCQNGCGHYFWIVNIDEKNNVWVYDPFYGRKTLPPFNINQYWPYPKYRHAFGVGKKNYKLK